MAKHWKLRLTFLLIFCAGVAVGLAWSGYRFKRSFEQTLVYHHWIDNATAHLEKKLKLTPEQVPKVRALIDEAGQRIRDHLKQSAVECIAMLDDFGDRLDHELSPEQKAVHQEMRQQFRAVTSKMLGIDRDKGNSSPGE